MDDLNKEQKLIDAGKPIHSWFDCAIMQRIMGADQPHLYIQMLMCTE